MYRTAKYILLFFVYSALGGFVETLFRLATEHHWYGVHGFLHIPILPIYGVGAILIILIGRHFRNPTVLFVLATLAAAILEFASSWIIEMVFGVRIWDYSNDPLNFQGRVRLSTAIGFGLAGVWLVYFINPRLVRLFERIPKRIAITIATAVAAVILIDIIFSVVQRLN